jgi:hypothetical protein
MNHALPERIRRALAPLDRLLLFLLLIEDDGQTRPTAAAAVLATLEQLHAESGAVLLELRPVLQDLAAAPKD